MRKIIKSILEFIEIILALFSVCAFFAGVTTILLKFDLPWLLIGSSTMLVLFGICQARASLQSGRDIWGKRVKRNHIYSEPVGFKNENSIHRT